MDEIFTIDQATGEPYLLHKNAHAVGGVEGVTLVAVTEDEFIEAAAKREHPLHKDRPKKGKGGKGKK